MSNQKTSQGLSVSGIKSMLPDITPSGHSLCALLLMLSSAAAYAAPPTIEIFAAGGNTTASGPTSTAQTNTYQSNANNPFDNAATTFNTPTTTVRYSLTSVYNNSRYSTFGPATQPGFVFGGTTRGTPIVEPDVIFSPLNSIGDPINSNFAATLQNAPSFCSNGATCSSGTTGGIDTFANYGSGLFAATRGIATAGLSTTGRHLVGTITVTFNRAVTNPTLHVSGLGAVGGGGVGIGFSTEFDLTSNDAVGGLVMSRLAGSRELTVTANSITNNAAVITETTGVGGASGSVYLNGRRMTSLSFNVYVRGDGRDFWDATAGDRFFFGVSSIEADNDISINKTQRPGTSGTFVGSQVNVVQGTPVQYQILLTNSSSAAVSGSTFSDVVPAAITGVSVVSTTPTGGASCVPTLSGNTISGTFSGPASSTCAIIVQGTATTLGLTTNTANLFENATDPNTTNNSSSVNTNIIPGTDLFITKTDNTSLINPLGTTAYTLTVTNSGPNTVTGAILSDPNVGALTEGAPVCHPTTPGQCTAGTTPTLAQLQSGAFTLPTLATGQTYVLNVPATLNAAVANVTNAASIETPSGTVNLGTSCVTSGGVTRSLSGNICTSTDVNDVRARVRIAKISNNGVDTFNFTSLTNLNNTTDSVTTASSGVSLTSTQANYSTALNAQVQINETVPANYTLNSASCTDANAAISGNPATPFGSLSSNQLTIPAANIKAGADITCTFTNNRIAQQINLVKQWTNGGTNHTAGVTTTGGTANPTLTSTSSGNNSTTGTAVTVYAGDTLTLPAETFGGGAVAGQYNSTLACTGGSTLASGAIGRSLTIANSATATTCTYTNSRVAQQINLVKQWTNGGTNHTAGVTTTGGTANPTITSTSSGNNSTTGTAVTVYAGDVLTLPAETFGGGAVAGQYNSTLACTGGSTLASGAVARNLTIANSATATTCTYTNSRVAQQINLVKQWTNAINNHTATVTTTGGTLNPSINSTATGGSSSTTGTAVTVYAGDVLTLPAETFGGGAVAGQYNSTLECTGGSTLTSGTVGRSLTIANSATATTCTYTNSRFAQQINLVKQWTNGVNNHTATVTTTGGTLNPSVNSTATGGSSSTTGTAVTVYAGDVLTLPAETFGGGAVAGQYNSTLACTGGSTLASGAVARSLTIANSATATTCTYTNSRIAKNLTLQKTWVNAITNDAINVTATGLTSLTSVANTANETDVGAVQTVYVGDVLTLGETFSTGNAANYNNSLACTGTSGLSGSALTVGAADGAIVCTQTNSRKSTTLRLAKAWGANSTVGNVANLPVTTGLINNTAAFTSTANTATNGATVTVFAGETATLPAETMSVGTLANYSTVISCNAGTLTGTNGQSAGNTLAITAASTATTPITCTYTNTPIPAVTITGRVFDDNSGTTGSASAAYNGTQQNGETGIPGSQVALTNCSSTIVATTTTNAGGDYFFSVPPSQLPTPNFCVVETNVSGYTSVSGTSGYSRASDTITISNTGASTYANHNFGDARLGLILLEEGQQTIAAGAVADYPHRLTAQSVLTIDSFAVTNSQQPANSADQTWQNLVYRDNNCNGKVDSGETLLSTTLPLSMLPNQDICLVQRVYAPSNASNGAQHLGKLQASFSVALNTPTQTITGQSNQRQDTTLVSGATLSMQKSVRTVASCPSTAADTASFSTQNQAKNGSFLEYEITYRNNSTKNLVNVTLKDSIPTGTLFQSMECKVTPSSLTSCTPINSGATLAWQTAGLLLPNNEGTVRFCVQIP